MLVCLIIVIYVFVGFIVFGVSVFFVLLVCWCIVWLDLIVVFKICE